MLYYSFVFALEGKKPNEYLSCLTLLYRTLQTNGALRPNDEYVVMTDKATLEVVKQSPALKGIRWLVRQAPKTVYEGMRWKYDFPTLVNLPDGTLTCYLDVDVLVARPIRLLLPDDSLGVFPEGNATDSNYCGDTPLDAPTGATAGIFAYRWGPRVRGMFSTILENMAKEDKGFYTLDQPYFNHALRDGAIYLPPDFISFNGHNNPGATLLNFCGEPGDGGFHFNKMLNYYLCSFAR